MHICMCVCVFERQGYKDIEEGNGEEIEIFQSAGPFPKWPQSPGLGQAEAESPEIFPGLPCGCRMAPGLPPLLSQGHSQGLDQKKSSQDQKPAHL